MKVSVIIPCYNEEDTIAETINRVKNVSISYEKEILVVDDNSTDDSVKITQRFTGVRLLQHTVNRGKGAAVQTGVASATGDIIVIQDADLEYNPREIPKLIEPIVKGETEIVYGSRFLGACKGMSKSHFLGNKVLSLTASILYSSKITDIMTAHKVFRTSILKGVQLNSKGFEFEVEITAKVLNRHLKIVEIPIIYKYRESGKAKIRWKDGLKSLWWLFKCRIKG